MDLKHRVGKLYGVTTTTTEEPAAVKEETFEILSYEKLTGGKIGDYEVANRNQNIPEKFSHAYGILSKSNAVISKRYHGPGYRHTYWLYGEDRIYRQVKKEASKTEKVNEQASDSVRATRALFPKDLEDMLLFEEKEDYIVIKPRQYLGSDNFAKIAAIVRDANGEYVSAGKESHFRVPKRK